MNYVRKPIKSDFVDVENRRIWSILWYWRSIGKRKWGATGNEGNIPATHQRTTQILVADSICHKCRKWLTSEQGEAVNQLVGMSGNCFVLCMFVLRLWWYGNFWWSKDYLQWKFVWYCNRVFIMCSFIRDHRLEASRLLCRIAHFSYFDSSPTNTSLFLVKAP